MVRLLLVAEPLVLALCSSHWGSPDDQRGQAEGMTWLPHGFLTAKPFSIQKDKTQKSSVAAYLLFLFIPLVEIERQTELLFTSSIPQMPNIGLRLDCSWSQEL